MLQLQCVQAAAGLNFPELSWELAEGLVQTLLETSTPDNPFMPTRLAMIQQLQADAARALVSSDQTATAVRAMQLLMTFGGVFMLDLSITMSTVEYQGRNYQRNNLLITIFFAKWKRSGRGSGRRIRQMSCPPKSIKKYFFLSFQHFLHSRATGAASDQQTGLAGW